MYVYLVYIYKYNIDGDILCIIYTLSYTYYLLYMQHEDIPDIIYNNRTIRVGLSIYFFVFPKQNPLFVDMLYKQRYRLG